MIIISSGQSTNVRRKVPFFGIYVVMFIDVSYTFLKVSVVVILFIVAFAFGFFVLFDNQPYFKTFWLSLVKTVIMTSGEMEYDNLFFDNEKYNDGVVMVPYPDTTRMLFLFFSKTTFKDLFDPGSRQVFSIFLFTCQNRTTQSKQSVQPFVYSII